MSLSESSLPTIFDPSTCVRKGLCPVTSILPSGDPSGVFESHSLYYEQHGKGTRYKFLLINGLNSSSFSWAPQVRWLASGKAMKGEGECDSGVVKGEEEATTVVVFDNRGVGNSGTPRGPYTTGGMADDVVCLLDMLGWTGERELHVVGISLGGMIAQELALKIPERMASLVLGVTTRGGMPWNNLPPWKGVKSLTKLTFTPDPVKKVPVVLDMLFPLEWLDEQDEDEPTKTNRQVQTEEFLRRATLTRPQQFMGNLSQMAAGLTHHVTPEQLRKIGGSVPKVTIVTGDEDHLVRPWRSHELKKYMPEAELVEWTGTGHAFHLQRRSEFNALVERTAREGIERVR